MTLYSEGTAFILKHNASSNIRKKLLTPGADLSIKIKTDCLLVIYQLRENKESLFVCKNPNQLILGFENLNSAEMVDVSRNRKH